MMKSILKKAILLAFVAAISMATFAQQKKPISTPPPKPTPYDEKQDEDLRKGLADQEAKRTRELADQEARITKITEGLADQEVKITKGLADQEKRRALYAEGRNKRLDQHEKDIGTNEDDIAINTETLGKHETAIAGNTKATKANAVRVGEHEQLIYSNKTSSEANAGRIEDLDDEVGENIVEIEANKEAIAGNTETLGEHGKAIDGNKTAIAGNTATLGKHETAIDSNKTAIAGNTETLGKHETAIDGNTKAIAGNTNKLEKIDNVIDVKGKELHIIGSGLHVKKGTTVHMGMNQVHGVANGTNLYDAVNVSQLRDTETRLHSEINRVDKNASRGIAAAMASAGLNQASLPGKYMLSAGAASYRGKGALAVGFSTLSADGQWAFKGSVNANSKDAGVNLSVGYQW